VRIARLKAYPEWIAPEKIGDKWPELSAVIKRA